uniref:tRNA:m(4)X modification enzyme TRM13 n=1 Tax=Amphimedon queenslandica TaxID=400682 RepID=A0A1X7SH15_AMPQE
MPPLATPPLSGIIIALCCHQRCQWDSIYGIELWKELGFNSIDFHLITLMSSWAVCGQRSADKDTKGYIPHAKEPMGLKCKELINLIRVHELRKNGFQTHLLYYVDRRTSLENVLLIALPH